MLVSDVKSVQAQCTGSFGLHWGVKQTWYSGFVSFVVGLDKVHGECAIDAQSPIPGIPLANQVFVLL